MSEAKKTSIALKLISVIVFILAALCLWLIYTQYIASKTEPAQKSKALVVMSGIESEPTIIVSEPQIEEIEIPEDKTEVLEEQVLPVIVEPEADTQEVGPIQTLEEDEKPIVVAQEKTALEQETEETREDILEDTHPLSETLQGENLSTETQNLEDQNDLHDPQAEESVRNEVSETPLDSVSQKPEEAVVEAQTIEEETIRKNSNESETPEVQAIEKTIEPEEVQKTEELSSSGEALLNDLNKETQPVVEADFQKTEVLETKEEESKIPVLETEHQPQEPSEDSLILKQEKQIEEKSETADKHDNLADNEQKNVEDKDQYYIAVVVDDLGINIPRTKDMISIKAPLTASFLTYGKNLKEFYQTAQQSGHEIIVHAPMQPKASADVAPDSLKVSMSDAAIEAAFEKMLAKFDDAKVKGVNNHMGSLFTESAAKLDVVMRVLKERGLFFLDSRTTAHTKGKEVAALNGVDYLKRDVFLDNENNYQYILNQFKKAEQIAKKQGYAVAICHPKSQTYKALKDWLETLKDKDVKLVHLDELIELQKKKIIYNKKSS